MSGFALQMWALWYGKCHRSLNTFILCAILTSVGTIAYKPDILI